MSGTGIPQVSFSSGELAPALYGRVDLARYTTALKTARNFLVRQYGGVSSRPGTYFVGESKSSQDIAISGKVRLIPFTFNQSQTYVLELGLYLKEVIDPVSGPVLTPTTYIRFIYQGAYILSGGVTYEIDGPWYDIAHLSKLSVTQSADVLTVCHPSYPPYQIRRHAHDSWDCIPFVNKGGPFTELNTDETWTLFTDGVKGKVTLTANKPGLFSSGDIGNLFFVEQMPDYITPKWEAGDARNTINERHAGDVVMAGNNFYRAMNTAYSGTIRPSHLEGEAADGSIYTVLVVNVYVPSGVIWSWIHDGRGIVRIDELIESTADVAIESCSVELSGAFRCATTTAHGFKSGDLVYVHLTAANTGNVLLDGNYQVVVYTTTVFELVAYVAPNGFDTNIGASYCRLSTGSKALVTVQGTGELPTRISGFTPVVNIISIVDDGSGSSTSDGNNPPNYTYNNDGQALVTTNMAHGLATNNLVKIAGIVGLEHLNTRWNVTVIDSTSFTLNGSRLSHGTYVSGGTVTSYNNVPTYKWAKCAWGGDQGYPSCCCFFQQRMWFAGTTGNPQGLWSSVTGGYYDFSTSLPIIDSDAITRSIRTNQVNQIQGLAPLSELLLLTTGGPFALNGDQQGVYTPAALSAKPQGTVGCAALPVVLVDNFCIYTQAKSTCVKAIGYNWASNVFQGKDVSKFSNHLVLGHTIKSWAYQEAPFSIIWLVRDDGILLSFTFMPEDEVIGWSWHDTSGTFDDVCVVSEGNEDAVYVAVTRNNRQFIERFATRQFTSAATAHCVDSGAVYSGTPRTYIDGLDHLEGRNVAVTADGVYKGLFPVVNGAVSFDFSASNIHAGLPYTCDLETLEVVAQGSNLRDKQKIINHLSVLLQDSVLPVAGPDSGKLTPFPAAQYGLTETMTGLRSGIADLRILATWNKHGRVLIRQAEPLPVTVLAITPEVAAGGS